MQPIMQRWRQQVQPEHPLTPRNLMEYADLLQQPEWQNLKSYENDELSVQTIPVADGSFVSVIGSVNFLGLLNPTRLFMDATFKITPKKPQIYQFFTIMGLIDDTALPVCWMFMTRKSSLAYTAGLTYFKNQLAPHIQPEIIIIDFESSLEIATRLAFPLAKIVGCNFHYCQALMKKFKKYNLLQFCKEWLPGQIIMRKFLALALLPHHDILTAFNWLVENLPIDVHQIFAPFIQYFRRQWLLRVPPIRYSVHNEEYRTNNNSESSNRRNKLRFGIHPKIWTFNTGIITRFSE
ncbi:uncharacterized protein LOC130670404 [Microplitis mediator]|uniref:uncharacterized protein LOC130670404 n=1 Tax=Microplitis mediator TaxID=375433 RepID=UPI0025577A25|nr:uncharacterized protein LOC130670404 [Microplitis mediator]